MGTVFIKEIKLSFFLQNKNPEQVSLKWQSIVLEFTVWMCLQLLSTVFVWGMGLNFKSEKPTKWLVVSINW